LCLYAAALLLSGCGGAGAPPNPAPPPTITSLSPPSAAAGSAAFTLTVSGTGFEPASVVDWNGSPRTTMSQSASVLTVAIPAADVASPGTATVTVVNPPPGGTSNALTFTVNSGTTPRAGVIGVVSVATDGTQGNGNSGLPAISTNGRFAAFVSLATNLVTGNTNGFSNVFLRDTCGGAQAGCTPSTVAVSMAPDGTLGNGDSGESIGFVSAPSISADGRFVAFASSATNLVLGDTNGARDIFVRDTCVRAPAGCIPNTTRVSVATDGIQANGDSRDASISADGRFVAFSSVATNLVPGDTNNSEDIFVRDTCFGAPVGCTLSTTRVSVATDGTQGNDGSFSPSISADGHFVAFASYATNLAPNDTNIAVDVFVRDTCMGVSPGCTPSTSLISVATNGNSANFGSVFPSISPDGRFVAFPSFATNLIPGGTTNAGYSDIFVRDTCLGANVGCTPRTTLVSVSTDGAQGNKISALPSISAQGRFIAFDSDATNLVPGDTNGFTDIFVRDTCAGAPPGCTPTTVRVSVAADGTQGNFNDGPGAISRDGHFVVFGSGASNLVPDGTNGKSQVFLTATGF